MQKTTEYDLYMNTSYLIIDTDLYKENFSICFFYHRQI